MPSVATEPPWLHWGPCHQLGTAAWADDYVLLQIRRDRAGFCRQIIAATQVMVEHATAMGMVLTFAKEKTAVLLDAACLPEGIVQDAQLGPGLQVPNTLLRTTEHLPIVDSYRHLGGIITANHAPLTDIAFRKSQADATLKPLKGRLFSSQHIPVDLRRTLLRSLVISRFVFAGASLFLYAHQHRRQWCRHYVSLWGGLVRRTAADKSPHSFDVLHQAKAPSPLLALAMMRAVQLRRMLQHGPAQLLHILHAHWRLCAAKSLLGMFLLDIQAVAVYCDAARALQAQLCPVTALIEAAQDHPNWWILQVRKAVKGYLVDLDRWVSIGRPSVEATCVPAALRPFQCRWCEATFASIKLFMRPGPMAVSVLPVCSHIRLPARVVCVTITRSSGCRGTLNTPIPV